MQQKKQYTAPDVVRLGKATTLTLGGGDCGIDDYLCHHKSTELQ